MNKYKARSIGQSTAPGRSLTGLQAMNLIVIRGSEARAFKSDKRIL